MQIHPGASLVIMIVAAAAAEKLLSAAIDIPLMYRVGASAVVLLPAAALSLWAIRTLALAGTAIEPHKEPSAIVTAGPFRFSRNPMYVASVLTIVSFFFLTGSAWFLAAAMVQFLILNVLIIPKEEERLTRAFPEIANGWFSRTRRWM